MGIEERKLRDRERRIEEILVAARALFLDKGYLHTTMLDIAEKSDLSRRTLYLYFKSKEEITFAVMVDAFSLLRARLEESQTRSTTAVEKLFSMRDTYLSFYHQNFNDFYFTLYFDLKLNIKNITTEDAAACFKIIADIMHSLAGVLRQGIAEGSLRPMENPDRTAFTIGTIIMSTMQKVAIRKELLEYATSFSEEELIQEMFRQLFLSLIA